MISGKENWKWYGFQGHTGLNCKYHLCTLVGKHLVSTIGLAPDPDGGYLTLGTDEDSYFETFVFRCYGEDEYGNPNNDLTEIDFARYKDSIKAEAGHLAMCEKYDLQS